MKRTTRTTRGGGERAGGGRRREKEDTRLQKKDVGAERGRERERRNSKDGNVKEEIYGGTRERDDWRKGRLEVADDGSVILRRMKFLWGRGRLRAASSQRERLEFLDPFQAPLVKPHRR